MNKLQNKIAVVTGGNSGIGYAKALKTLYGGFEKNLFKDMEKATLADLVNKMK